VRRITKAALGGLAGFALVVGGTQAATGALSEILKVREDSGDFLTSTDQPLDAAKAKITIVEGTGSSTSFTVRITGIDPSVAGTALGGHLHTGRCVEGDSTPKPGLQAGPHYNREVVEENKVFPASAMPGDDIAEVSPKTEVWFDFVADAEGMAYDQTTVSFTPDDSDPLWVPGVMSIVVHVKATNTDPLAGPVGDAGARQACFPVSVPEWAD
jgi:Cu/Zn superoxide dismutase